MDEFLEGLKEFFKKKVNFFPGQWEEDSETKNQKGDFLHNLEPMEDIEENDNTLFKPVSRETTWKRPVKVNDNGFMSRDISMKETDQGMERHIEEPLIVAACGKVIHENDIGVRCSFCSQYDCKDHTFLCHSCSMALCIVHTHFFRNESGNNVPFCERHYREAVENQDTWKIMPDILNKRNGKSDREIPA